MNDQLLCRKCEAYTLRPLDELHWVDFCGFNTSISGSCHFEFKITQTSVFLNFLKTVPDGNWNLKVHKNQCFMNDQLLCGKCQPLMLRAQDKQNWVYFYGYNQQLRLLPS